MVGLFENAALKSKQEARRAVALNYSGRLFEMAMVFAHMVIMAHWLTPRDFGILAMISPIMWLLMQFGDLGLAAAALQERNLDRERASVLLFVSLTGGALLCGAFYACSGLIGSFYAEPSTARAAAALSPTFLFSGASAIQVALLRRSFQYGLLMRAQVTAASSAFLLAVAVAWQGGGYWALVARAVVEPLVLMLVVWALAPWRPCRPRAGPETRRLLRYGAYAVAASSLSAGGRQIDHVLIGWRFGSADLGQYALAYRLFQLPVQLLAWPLGHVMIPILSHQREDPAQLVASYVAALRWVGLGAIPLFLTLAVCAPDVVAVVAGPQWESAGHILRILAPVGAIQGCVVCADWLLQAHGRSDRAFRLAGATTAATAVAFGLGLPWGAPGVAWALVAVSALMAGPSFAYAVAGTPVRMRDVATALAPALVLGVALALAVLELRAVALGDWTPLARVAVCAAIGAATLAAGAWRLVRHPRPVAGYAGK